MLHLPSEYTLEIPLPPDIDDQSRRWAERTPGATWPRWGGHITVLNRFFLESEFERVIQEVDAVCAAYHPFVINLCRITCEAHLLDANLKVVLLVSGSQDEGAYLTLLKLHDSVRGELAPLTRNVQPEISKRPYDPHLSLTSGLPQPEAIRLMEAARASRLRVKFTVEKVSLLEFVQGTGGEKDARQVHSFALIGS